MAEPIVTVASGVVVVDAEVAAMAIASAVIATAKIVDRNRVRIAAIVHLATTTRKSANRDATSPPRRKEMQTLMPMRLVVQNRRSRNHVNRNPPNRHSKPATLKPLTKAKVADAVVAVAVGVAVHAMGARVVRKEGQARRHPHRRANSVDQTKSKT